MKNVTIITNSTEKGGEANFVENVTWELMETKHQVKTISFLHKESQSKSYPSRVFLNPRFIFNKPVPSMRDFRDFKKDNSDVVLHLVFGLYSILFFIFLKKGGRKHIASFHTDLIGRKYGFSLFIYKIFKFKIVNFFALFADSLVFLTKSQREDFRKYCIFKKKFDSKAKVVFYSTMGFSPIVGKKIFRKLDPRLSLIFVGRLTDAKGFDDLISVMRDMKGEKVVFHAVGVGPLLGEALKLENFVYHGELSKEETSKVYDECDALILPSYSEGFGRVILESMFKGIVVISSALPQVEEKLTEGVNGFFFKPGDREVMKEKIRKVMNLSTDELSKISQNNLAFVSDLSEGESEYVKLIEEI